MHIGKGFPEPFHRAVDHGFGMIDYREMLHFEHRATVRKFELVQE